jgi:hypothetical protein
MNATLKKIYSEFREFDCVITFTSTNNNESFDIENYAIFIQNPELPEEEFVKALADRFPNITVIEFKIVNNSTIYER